LQNIVSIQLAELKNHDLRELRANYAERLESDIADLKEIITED
jgi:hypothetical protein